MGRVSDNWMRSGKAMHTNDLCQGKVVETIKIQLFRYCFAKMSN